MKKHFQIIFYFLTILFLSFEVHAQSINHPNKIGIGTWEVGSNGVSLENVEKLGFGWYYNWRTDHLWAPGTPDRKVPFVPMVWGEGNLADSLPSSAEYLLGFNEPDNRDQANMTVERAISLWPQLMAKGLPLGSPAPTTHEQLSENSWLSRFMAQANSKNYRVDFIAVHFYSDTKDVGVFKDFLEKVYAKYKKPIWITEWALVDWNNPGRYSATEIANYAKEALLMLDTLNFVHRHAWFSAVEYNAYGKINTHLFDSNNNLTEVGTVFKNVLSGAGSSTDPGDSNSGGSGSSDTSDNQAPTVKFLSHSDGDIIKTRSRVRLEVQAVDNVGVTQVVFYKNGRKICSRASAPYICKWRAPRRNKNITIKVEAYDAKGNVGSSSIVLYIRK